MTPRARSPRRLRLLALLAAAALSASASQAREATYLMRGGQLPVSATANGYVQTVTPSATGVFVHVETKFGPIGAEGSYETVRSDANSFVPEGFELPDSLQSGLKPDTGSWEAATRVLEWVMAHISLDNDDRAPQDAESVLRRRRGRCSGLANATTALLLAAGFEARSVSGLLIDEEGAIPHRWVECRLPGAGWVPTDPTLGLWTITPRHVAFADSVQRPPQVEVLSLVDGRLSELPFHHGRPLRPNVGGELVCRLVGLEGGRRGVAILRGPTGEDHRRLLRPEGRFAGLLPGRWVLVVELDGEVLERRELLLRAGNVHSFVIHVPPGSEIGS